MIVSASTKQRKTLERLSHAEHTFGIIRSRNKDLQIVQIKNQEMFILAMQKKYVKYKKKIAAS